MEGIFLHTVIFANGQAQAIHTAWRLCQPADWIIAADGGWHHLQALHLQPDVLIGDFDSISPTELQSIQTLGIKTIQHPRHKDETDLELALRYAIQNGSSSITIVGGLGARWDQTLANMLLLTQKEFQEIPISLVDGNQVLFTISASIRSHVQIEGQPGDTVSLLPLMGDVHGITTSGLEYPLHNETLIFGSTRGVSNTLLRSSAKVSIRSGILMIVVIHHSETLPQEVQNE
ncbi:MAG: thiamine diphosphokinase, partial [Anaerolineales bacterium]